MNKPHGAQRLIVPLDVPDAASAVRLATQVSGQVGALKVGLELFNASGPAIFGELAASELPIFYDAKLHDIPNTVAGAVRAATQHGLWMLNVHCSGGAAMLRAAAEAARAAAQPPLLIGVTVLTSLDAAALRDELGVAAEPLAQVVHLARLAQACGLDGVVCSPREAAAVRAACGPEFVLVTPGVRPASADLQDQKRVATPAAAVAAGADYLVIGRPITAAPDPAAAAAAIAAELD
ncbi:MAG: orotidine-5'-phosphate decarboxylase [Fimbriimonadaceae bacterium]|nr:orotidine-5'-phosphate decarboxylase [Fimbriimonadaceae bacterium]